MMIFLHFSWFSSTTTTQSISSTIANRAGRFEKDGRIDCTQTFCRSRSGHWRQLCWRRRRRRCNWRRRDSDGQTIACTLWQSHLIFGNNRSNVIWVAVQHLAIFAARIAVRLRAHRQRDDPQRAHDPLTQLVSSMLCRIVGHRRRRPIRARLARPAARAAHCRAPWWSAMSDAVQSRRSSATWAAESHCKSTLVHCSRRPSANATSVAALQLPRQQSARMQAMVSVAAFVKRRRRASVDVDDC
jgi:hypothetical protein